MIYDCFSYWDEDLLLDLRLNILNKFVDFFVIVEGDKTWQNNKKNLRFDINKFNKFKKKIIYIPVQDLPDGDDPYLRENHQRNCILRGLSKANDNDLIIISDLDEIPNPETIAKFKPSDRFSVLKQKHFSYKLNLQTENNPYWLGTRLCIKKYLKSPQWLRDLNFKYGEYLFDLKTKKFRIIKLLRQLFQNIIIFPFSCLILKKNIAIKNIANVLGIIKFVIFCLKI